MQEESRRLQEGDVFSKERVNQNAPLENGPESEGGLILSGAAHSLPQLSCASWENSHNCMVEYNWNKKRATSPKPRAAPSENKGILSALLPAALVGAGTQARGLAGSAVVMAL